MMTLIKSAADYASEKSKQNSEPAVTCAEVVDIGEYKVKTVGIQRILEK